MVFGLGFNVRECKLACIQGVNRIKLFRNKKIAELASEKKNVADQINKGSGELGMMRVEQVIRIENLLKALEILELFLEMIKTRIDYLSKLKTIPQEMRTSLLSIAYASTRINDIPELAGIRKNFEARFGRDEFAEVVKGDPGPTSGVQENLIRYLSVLPPPVSTKVDKAEEIMEQLGSVEVSRADLEKWAGSFAPSTSSPRASIPFPTAQDPFGLSAIAPQVQSSMPPPPVDPTPVDDNLTPVNDHGNPAPAAVPGAFSAGPPPGAAFPYQPSPYPVPPPLNHSQPSPLPPTAGYAPDPASAAATVADIPSAVPPSGGSVGAESYTDAMKAALSGSSTPALPLLDSTNPGPEAYAGASVHGSTAPPGGMPAPPPGAFQQGEKASDSEFPQVNWLDRPPNLSIDAGDPTTAAAFPNPPSDLPPAPTHDPEMPAAPKFSHTGVVYDTDPDAKDTTEASVQEDLVDRLRRLRQQ